MKMQIMRSNQEWLALLNHETCDVALAELSVLMRQGLRRGLARYPWVDDMAIEGFIKRTLLALPEEIDRFTGQSRFTTWAMKFAVHIAMGEIRGQRSN